MAENTCTVCGGECLIENVLCLTCMGTGAVPLKGMLLYLKDTFDIINDILNKCNDIKEKCDEIMAKLNEP